MIPRSVERKFGRELAEFSRGMFQQEVPGKEHATISDFSGGYDSRDAAEDIPRNTSPYFIDMELSAKDEIIRAPGIATLETFATRTPDQLVPHAKQNQTSQLLLVDAPFLGVFDGVSTAWTDHTLAAGIYAWTNFGGDLIFSPGATAMYMRTDAGVVSAITGAPPAKALANFAARIFAGQVVSGGNYVPMGVMWSGSSSSPTDWTGAGSGFEELISNSQQADAIQALVPLGFDLMAIICRRSLWVGSRTGIANRPADFQERVTGLGAVSPQACAATPYGVAFLSDDGVIIFNGSSHEPLSEQINNDLLELDFNKLSSYALHYHPARDRLYVVVPGGVWIYEFQRRRWFRRAVGLVGAAPVALAQNSYDIYFIGTDVANRRVLGREDATKSLYLDAPMAPVWDFPVETGGNVEWLFTTSGIYLSYIGGGTVEVWQPSVEGVFEFVTSATLSEVQGKKPRSLLIPFMHTGQNLAVQLRLISGKPRISRLELDFVPRGPRFLVPDTRADTLIAVLTTGGYWVFLPYTDVEGLQTGGWKPSNSGLLLSTGEAGSKVIRRQSDNYITLSDI